MKTIKQFCAALLVAAGALCVPQKAQAQISLNTYYNIDWQFNIPMNNDFANVASGWGMNFEGGYYVTDNLALGAFLSYHTNNEYFSRRTIQLGYNSALNTDQQHSLFQLPFGLLVRYRMQQANFQPYVGLKLGAEYAQYTAYYYIFESDQNRWGFHASPEVGFNFYPWANGVGFHMAIYYSFSTNSSSLMGYDTSCINNLGFRLGFAF